MRSNYRDYTCYRRWGTRRRASSRQAALATWASKKRAPGSVAVLAAEGGGWSTGAVPWPRSLQKACCKAWPGNSGVFSQRADREKMPEHLAGFRGGDNWQVIRSCMNRTGRAERKSEVSPRRGVPCRRVAGEAAASARLRWEQALPGHGSRTPACSCTRRVGEPTGGAPHSSPVACREQRGCGDFFPVFALKTWSCGCFFPRVLEIERVKVMKIC